MTSKVGAEDTTTPASCQEARKPEPKPLVRASRPRVLWRLGTHHLIPVAVCVPLLYLNLATTYLGNNLPGTLAISDATKLQVLQWIAKVHEIFMAASLALAVFDLVRYQLFFSERGIPLGLVGSGLFFNNASFIISKEFRIAFKSAVSTTYKIALGLLLVLCGVGNLVGPSSAMLLIPSNQTWSTAVYKLSLNGSADDLWPNALLARHIGAGSCSNSTALSDPKCVAGGYTSLIPYFSDFNQYPAQFAFTLHTQDKLAKRRSLGNIRNDWEYGSESWTQSTHVAATMVAEPIRSRWADGLRFLSGSKQWTDICTARMKTEVPLVRTVCVPMTKLMQSPSGSFTMAFPVLPEYAFWYYPDPEKNSAYGNGPTANLALDNSLLKIGNHLTRTESSLLVNTHWLTLPKEFGSTSTGAVIFFSKAQGNDTTFSLGVSCAVDARWSKGENSLTTAQSDWAWAGYSQPMQSSVFSRRTPYDNYGSKRLFLPVDDGNWRRVAISTDWAEALTPEVERRGTSSLGAILEDQVPEFLGSVDRLHGDLSNGTRAIVPMLEHVLATLVADGMARVGSHLQLSRGKMQDILSSIPYNKFSLGGSEVEIQVPVGASSTPLSLETEVVGYGYKITSGTGYFAVMVMFLYLLVVTIHTIMALSHGVASSAWETVPCLLTLAMSARLDKEGATTNKSASANLSNVVITALPELDGRSGKTIAMVRSGGRLEKVSPGEVYLPE